MSDFVARQGELTERLGEGERVYVVCRVGGRSAQVAAYLLQQGLDAVNVDGGMLAWESAGRPLVGEAEPAVRALRRSGRSVPESAGRCLRVPVGSWGGVGRAWCGPVSAGLRAEG